MQFKVFFNKAAKSYSTLPSNDKNIGSYEKSYQCIAQFYAQDEDGANARATETIDRHKRQHRI